MKNVQIQDGLLDDTKRNWEPVRTRWPIKCCRDSRVALDDVKKCPGDGRLEKGGDTGIRRCRRLFGRTAAEWPSQVERTAWSHLVWSNKTARLLYPSAIFPRECVLRFVRYPAVKGASSYKPFESSSIYLIFYSINFFQRSFLSCFTK